MWSPLYKTDMSAKYFKFLSWLTQVRDMKGGARNEFHCGIDDPISVGENFNFESFRNELILFH